MPSNPFSAGHSRSQSSSRPNSSRSSIASSTPSSIEGSSNKATTMKTAGDDATNGGPATTSTPSSARSSLSLSLSERLNITASDLESKIARVIHHFSSGGKGKEVQIPLDENEAALDRGYLGGWVGGFGKGGGKKSGLSEQERFWLSRQRIVRYLDATKGDVPQAISRLTDTLVWRRTFSVRGLMGPEAGTGMGADEDDPDVAAEAARCKHFYCGTAAVPSSSGVVTSSGTSTPVSSSGTASPSSIASASGTTSAAAQNRRRLIHYVRPTELEPASDDAQVKHAVWFLEMAEALSDPDVGGTLMLVDMATSRTKKPSLTTTRQALYILQTHYPNRLDVAYFRNMSSIVSAFLPLTYPFMDARTSAKLRIGGDPLEDGQATKEELHVDWGGVIDFQPDHPGYYESLKAKHARVISRRLEAWRAMGSPVGYDVNALGVEHESAV